MCFCLARVIVIGTRDYLSIELFPLIYVKSTFIKEIGWNFINDLYMLWYI